MCYYFRMTTTLEHRSTLTPEARSASVAQLAGAFLAAQTSPQTVSAYRSDLHEWFAYCKQHEADPLTAKRPGIDAFRLHLDQLGRKPATVARKLACLASFYEYAIEAEACSANPVGRVKRPRTQTQQATGADAAGLERLLEAASNSPRDFCLIALLAGMGLRVSEACSLDAGSLSSDRGRTWLTFVRKGGKQQRLPVPAWVAAAIDDALGFRAGGSIRPVLLANDGGRLDRHDAGRIVRRLARAADVEGVTPHALRHSFVTLSLEAGAPLHKAQDAAGHADPRTTQGYNDARESLTDNAFDTLGEVIERFGTFHVLTPSAARPLATSR